MIVFLCEWLCIALVFHAIGWIQKITWSVPGYLKTCLHLCQSTWMQKDQNLSRDLPGLSGIILHQSIAQFFFSSLVWKSHFKWSSIEKLFFFERRETRQKQLDRTSNTYVGRVLVILIVLAKKNKQASINSGLIQLKL